MRYSMLIYGEKEFSFEPVIFNSSVSSWRPLVVSLSGENPLLSGEDFLFFDFSHLTSGGEALKEFFESVEKRVNEGGYSAVVFTNLSLFSFKVLSHYKKTEGERAGFYSFTFTRYAVERAVRMIERGERSLRLYFYSFAKKVLEQDGILGEERELIRPALGRKTLDLLLPRFTFIAFYMHHEGKPVLFFRTRTGKVLVKDPLGKLSGEEADLGALEQKIEKIVKERRSEAHT